jgi:hypothetical protein
MKLFKLIALVVAGLFIAVPTWAGNIPEFDAVGCDATNYFAARNSAQYGQVIVNNIGPNGPVNYYSGVFSTPTVRTWEYFNNTAGQLFPDPCFPGYLSAMTDAWNQGIYEWQIVLQMKPESDLNVNIYDCVLKHNSFDIWEGADQTGRYRAPWGQLFFVPTANPIMTVKAIPGQYATPGFTSPIILDARVLPGLDLVPMDGQLYTSKALWSEGLVMALPQTGNVNGSGQAEYNLKQGDMIRVTVEIPYNNTVDLFYGQDSVILKYIGIIGTWNYGALCATPG